MWDLAIFIPNLLFLVFLCLRVKRARLKLYATNSPIFLTLYLIVWFCVVLSLTRCLASMAMSALDVSPDIEGPTDKVLWTIVRFAMLTAEMSVLVFGMSFGRSIKVVLITTCLISLVFSVTQGKQAMVVVAAIGDDRFLQSAKLISINLFAKKPCDSISIPWELKVY